LKVKIETGVVDNWRENWKRREKSGCWLKSNI